MSHACLLHMATCTGAELKDAVKQGHELPEKLLEKLKRGNQA